jgi:glycosyltransferase involved in cell wall biosynthesis
MRGSIPRTPISVVINTYNRALSLARTLESLRRQTYPEFEVIVVNGPSTDTTELLLEGYAADLKIARCPEAKLGVSRNIGIKMASGEIVAFIDDDAVADDTWLEKLGSAYTKPSVAAVGGHVFDIPLGHIAWRICTSTRTGDVLIDAPPPVGKYLRKGSDPFLYLSGCNMSFRWAALAAIGGFNEAFAYGYDDVELCCRLIDARHRIALLKDAIVYHQRAPNSMRDRCGVARDLYPVFYARTVFALQSQTRNGSPEKILSRIRIVANRAAKAARHQLERGIFTSNEYEHFVRRINDAVDDGIATGSCSRFYRTFESPHSGAFHPYPRTRPARSLD